VNPSAEALSHGTDPLHLAVAFDMVKSMANRCAIPARQLL
jgi:hypothetical protein